MSIDRSNGRKSTSRKRPKKTPSTLNNGERQVATDVSGIRLDHVARYTFAAQTLAAGSKVLDLACGVGYGAWLMAEAGHKVTAVERNLEAVKFALKHFPHENVEYVCMTAEDIEKVSGAPFDAITCFETIEHLAVPKPVLDQLSRLAPRLIASVPNEEVFPFKNYAFHHRHYTRGEFIELLESSGWAVQGLFGQAGTDSPVEANVNGRTFLTISQSVDFYQASGQAKQRARPKTRKKSKRPPTARNAKPAPVTAGYAPDFEQDAPHPAPRAARFGYRRPPKIDTVPDHVAILGLGPSLSSFVEICKRQGGARALFNEVWGINAVGDTVRCDRVFHMDDVAVQEIRAKARPGSNIAAMVEWLKTAPGPIYTSVPRPGYRGLVAYPLEPVLQTLKGFTYLNNTAAYAVAFAIHIGVKKISLFGVDFTYPNAHHAERGRGSVEFLLGMAAARGIGIGLPSTTSLCDSCEPPENHFYGYDAFDVTVSKTEDGQVGVQLTEHFNLPDAATVERRYDHRRHPSALGEAERAASTPHAAMETQQ